MRDLVVLFVHIIATLAPLLGPGGIRSVVTESLLIKQQLLSLDRSRQRSPNLRSETFDSLEPPPNSEESKVSPALLIKAKVQARSKGTVLRTH